MNLVNDFDDWVNEWLHDGDRVCVHSIPQSLRLLVAFVPRSTYGISCSPFFGCHFLTSKQWGATSNILTALRIKYYTYLCTLKPNNQILPICKVKTLHHVAQGSELPRFLHVDRLILERVTAHMVRCAVKRGTKESRICNPSVPNSHRMGITVIWH